MQTTNRPGASPTTPMSTLSLYAGDGLRTTGAEIDFRMRRLAVEAEREQAIGPRRGLRARLGHALVALGREIHGLETEPVARPALRAR
jgi:hypothetical protein